MAEMSMKDLLDRRGLKQKKNFPMVETITANMKEKTMRFEDIPVEAREVFWQIVAEKLTGKQPLKSVKLGGTTETNPGGVVEPAPFHDEDDKGKVREDVANYFGVGKKKSKKFLVNNSSPRKPISDDTYSED